MKLIKKIIITEANKKNTFKENNSVEIRQRQLNDIIKSFVI